MGGVVEERYTSEVQIFSFSIIKKIRPKKLVVSTPITTCLCDARASWSQVDLA